MRLASPAALTAALVVLVPAGALGQFSQYTQPGAPSAGDEAVSRERLDQAIDEALWQLGPVRVEPWIGLRDLAWHSNPAGTTEETDPEGDLSANAGAGLRAYLPTGPAVVWSAHALPEYVWFADDDARRRLNGRYGAGVFGFFNRLTLQATATRTEALQILSAEAPEQANGRRDEVAAAGELELGFSTSVFAGASTARVENLLNEEERETGPPLDLLDRDEERLWAGVRYRPRERWSFTLGLEWTETDLLSEERDLSSSGEATTAGVVYTGPKFFLSTRAAFHSLEPEGDSAFPATDVTTYDAQLGVEGNRLRPVLYGRRTLSLAISEGYSHFETEAVGLRTELSLGHRTRVGLFAETGRSDFTALDPAVPPREDDLFSFGGELGLTLGRSFQVRLGGYRTEFDSNLPGQDRTVTVFSTGVTLGLLGEDGIGWP
jgi:hypothetical protein